MPIPTGRSIVYEILRQLADGHEHDLKTLRKQVIHSFQMTNQEQTERLPSGRETILANRIRNATYVLRKEWLATFPIGKYAVIITDKGRAYLSSHQNADIASVTAMSTTQFE